MNFTSLQFGLFFLSVFILHWYAFSRSSSRQNIFLLAASYCFYAWWDWHFLALLLINSVVPYYSARLIEKNPVPSTRKVILLASLATNLGVLVFFKYFGFFIDSFIRAFDTIGIRLHSAPLSIILPVGISFYTFTAMGYSLDVYNKKIKAAGDPWTFCLFIGFFPHLLAGPIGRATVLLPQFDQKREFKYGKAVNGARQVLWGLFKKIVIADGCAIYTDRIFGNFASLPGSTLFIGMLYYGIQIYADFSGYSDMAIGMGKLLGIDLMRNFAYPYFSTNISEFWRRWHISLSFWFRDYLFLPIAYAVNRKIKSASLFRVKAETWAYAIGIILTWFLVGLWHGASWNYVTWGLLHGCMLVAYHFIRHNMKRVKRVRFRSLAGLANTASMLATFILVQVTWVFFRSKTVSRALSYLSAMLSPSFFSRPVLYGSYLGFMVLAFVAVEWIQRHHENVLQIDGIRWPIARWGIYYFLAFAVLFFLSREQSFIYLQF